MAGENRVPTQITSTDLGLSEADRPRLVLVIWTVLGEAFENDQKSNFKLDIGRTESV